MQTLNATEKQKVSYCVETWVRDEQIKLAIARVKDRIQPSYALRHAPIAVVTYGPSLNETWEQIKEFPYIISCSGAHRFLIDRGLIPTWHLEVDPRPHKATLIGTPHPDVDYLIASTCAPKVFDLLEGFAVKLWHVFDTQDEGRRTLPHGEWALTGGCSVGLRALTMARFLGFTDLHVFGMDGSEGATGKHAAAHPMQAKGHFETVYDGITYQTTPAFLEAARQTFHELDQMTDVKATFYGTGLVQHMAQHYTPNHVKGNPEIAFIKEPLISPAYAALNAQLHHDHVAYGVGGGKYAPEILKIAERIKTHSILDYGCGKGYLAKAIPFPIWEYDPAIPGKQDSPRAADIVVCTDVLEHIEPERLGFVLDDLRRCVKQIGYFVIHTGPARKTLADGRNAHLIQQGVEWWSAQLSAFFQVGKIDELGGSLLRVVVGRKVKVVKAPLGLSFASLTWRREPYPIGLAAPVLDASTYQQLTATFPDRALFKQFGGGDEKFSLSERNNPDAYHQFIQGSAQWKAFYDAVKSPAFIAKVVTVLGAHKIPLNATAGQLRSRFEFSILPANGGLLRPHTDLASKVVTLVVSMQPAGELWDPAWGGGTDVLAQVDPAQTFADYQAPEDALTLVHTYPYQPNQCVVFVKTPQSWHTVRPLTGPAGQWRKTVTINLERV
jgi:Protein of unknown function DUF115/Methyltransferase domain